MSLFGGVGFFYHPKMSDKLGLRIRGKGLAVKAKIRRLGAGALYHPASLHARSRASSVFDCPLSLC